MKVDWVDLLILTAVTFALTVVLFLYLFHFDCDILGYYPPAVVNSVDGVKVIPGKPIFTNCRPHWGRQ